MLCVLSFISQLLVGFWEFDVYISVLDKLLHPSEDSFFEIQMLSVVYIDFYVFLYLICVCSGFVITWFVQIPFFFHLLKKRLFDKSVMIS